MKYLAMLFLLLGLLTACNTANSAPVTMTILSTQEPTPTVRIAVASETPPSTAVPPAQATAALLPTTPVTPFEFSTATPDATVTVVPLATGDVFWNDLQTKGYRLLFGGSLLGPSDYVYSAYGFIDTALEPTGFNNNLTAESCRLAVYRSDGVTNVLLRTFGGPLFPEGSRYHGFPVVCHLVNWDYATHFHVSDETKRLLRTNQYYSDINQNGKPEFTLYAWYCPNACDGNEGTLHFYEIQDTSIIVDITENLPGTIYPWKIVHSENPLTINVFDVGLEYEPHLEIEVAWVYQWEGDQFVDVSTQYADEYTSQADAIVSRVRDNFGKKFDDVPRNELNVLAVLFLYEKAGLSQQGLNIFLELTDSANWPGTEPYYACWLQIARANSQEQLMQNKPFALPPSTFYLDLNLTTDSPYWKTFDQTKYDFSGCKAFQP